MTDKLTETFFGTFGVEAKYKCTKDGNCYFQECSKCDWYIHTYPQITDRILLELMCILNNYGCTSFAGNPAMLKNEVLRNSIMCCEDTDDDKFKRQVRKLFEEG